MRITLLSNPEKIRTSLATVVSVLVEEGENSCSAVATTTEDTEQSLNDAIERATATAKKKMGIEDTKLNIALACAELGGKQAIKALDPGSVESNEMKTLCTDTQQYQLNDICNELGVPKFNVIGVYNLAMFYCLKSAMIRILEQS